MAATYRIDVVVSPRQAQAGVAAVERSLEDLNRTAASTNSLLRTALQVAGVTSGIILVQRMVGTLRELSDTYIEIQNRLSAVVSGTEELAQVTDDLLGVSQRTRTGFEATAQLYARTALATRELGIAQGDLLGVTESVNQAIILSGASAKEANNGLIQLSQAIASNRLGGDELRSVLEQLPVVADAIARELGVTRGELRALGSEGKITAQVIIDSFRNAQVALEQRFARTVPTVGQALTTLENSAISFVGQFNKITGVGTAVARSIQFLAANLQNLVFALGVAGAALAVRPLIQYVEATAAAARAQRELEEAVASGRAVLLGSAEAERQAAVRALTLADVNATSIDTAIVKANAERVAATASIELARAQSVQAESVLRASAADLRKAETSLAAAEADLVQARAVGIEIENETLLFGLETRLTAAQAARADAVLALTDAELAVAAATQAHNLVAGQEAALATQIAELQAARAAATEAQALAQGRLNNAIAGSTGPIGRVFNFLKANPFGTVTAGVVGLTLAFADLPDLFSTILDGVSLLGDAFAFLVGSARELASALPGVGTGLQTIVKFALVGGIAAGVLTGALAGLAATVGAIAAVGIALGQLKRAFDEVTEARRSFEEVRSIAPIGEEILANQKAVRLLQREIDSLNSKPVSPESAARIEQLEAASKMATDRLKELEIQAKKIQGTFKADSAAQQLFKDRIASIQEETRVLGMNRAARELELDLIRERERLERQTKKKLTPEQTDELRSALAAQQATRDLNRLLDEVRRPREIQIQIDQLEKANISADEFNRAVRILEKEKLDASPFGRSIADLRDSLRIASLTVDELRNRATGPIPQLDAAGQLEDLRAANREREIQAEIAQKIAEATDKGATDEELRAKRPLIESLVRQNAELDRQRQLREELLQFTRDSGDQAQLALLPPGFDQEVQRGLLQLRELKDVIEDPAAAEQIVRRNAALSELGSILNGLSEPNLALAQQQQMIADQQARVNELLAQGAITAQQYGTALEELNFRALKTATDFSSGFKLALVEASSNLTLAKIGAQTFSLTLDALGSASAEFVRSGTVDFRQYALNILAEISKLITQYLALAAVKAIAGVVPGPGSTAPVNGFDVSQLVPFTGLAGGGPFNANEPYIVGERGPELVRFPRSGNVVPNDQLVEAMANSSPSKGSEPVVVPAPQVNLRVVNMTDPRDSVQTAEGEREVLNIIDRNPSRVNRSLGNR